MDPFFKKLLLKFSLRILFYCDLPASMKILFLNATTTIVAIAERNFSRILFVNDKAHVEFMLLWSFSVVFNSVSFNTNTVAVKHIAAYKPIVVVSLHLF